MTANKSNFCNANCEKRRPDYTPRDDASRRGGRAMAVQDGATKEFTGVHPRRGGEQGEIVPRQFWKSSPAQHDNHSPTAAAGLNRARHRQQEQSADARVMINRIWQHHFGAGFVTTPDDFRHHVRAAEPPGVVGLSGIAISG